MFGQNIFSSLEPIQRKELSDEIFSLVTSANPTIFATSIIRDNQSTFMQHAPITQEHSQCSPQFMVFHASRA